MDRMGRLSPAPGTVQTPWPTLLTSLGNASIHALSPDLVPESWHAAEIGFFDSMDFGHCLIASPDLASISCKTRVTQP